MTPCASAPEVEIRRHCLFQIPAHERDDGQVMKTKVPATWTTQWIIFLGCFPHAIWLALQRQEMLFARTRPLEDDGLAITADHEGLRIYENQ